MPPKRDQADISVVTKGAAPSHVVNIEILGASICLTAPTIKLQDFSSSLACTLENPAQVLALAMRVCGDAAIFMPDAVT